MTTPLPTTAPTMHDDLPTEAQIWAERTGILRGRKARLVDGVLTPAECVCGCERCGTLHISVLPDNTGSAAVAQDEADRHFTAWAETHRCVHYREYLAQRKSGPARRKVRAEARRREAAQAAQARPRS